MEHKINDEGAVVNRKWQKKRCNKKKLSIRKRRHYEFFFYNFIFFTSIQVSLSFDTITKDAYNSLNDASRRITNSTLNPTDEFSTQPSFIQPRSSIPIIITTNAPSVTTDNVPTEIISESPGQTISSFPSSTPNAMVSNSLSISPGSTSSSAPTQAESNLPTIISSTSPSQSLSNFPSNKPSPVSSTVPTLELTQAPSITPSSPPSIKPTIMASHLPSYLPSTPPSLQPTSLPSSNPVTSPSSFPSTVPSTVPSIVPSTMPSSFPSSLPSTPPSLLPSGFPSGEPTSSPLPTLYHSEPPSQYPSIIPTDHPSNFPTFRTLQISTVTYEQHFLREEQAVLGSDDSENNQQISFCRILEGYTSKFASAKGVETSCEIIDQELRDASRRKLQETETELPPYWVIIIHYRMTFESRHFSVEGYNTEFLRFMNAPTLVNTSTTTKETVFANLQKFEKDLGAVGISVIGAFHTTAIPTMKPTHSRKPSLSPSKMATESPSMTPAFSSAPTSTHSSFPSSSLERKTTIEPTVDKANGPNTAGTVVLVLASIIGVVVVYNRLKNKSLNNGKFPSAFNETSNLAQLEPSCYDNEHDSDQMQPGGFPEHHVPPNEQARPEHEDPSIDSEGFLSHSDGGGNDESTFIHYPHNDPNIYVPPHEDIISKGSLLSVGLTVSSDNIIEQDSTHILIDEFDDFKHQGVESMRASVEDSISESDDMMSQAITKSLMSDDEYFIAKYDLDTLATLHLDAMDYEVSELCSIYEWRRKTQGATDDDRRSRLQETLDKMVIYVRYSILKPEDATRTLHGCAALLGWPLENDIPRTTLIVTGLRKTAEKKVLYQSFSEFGEIVGVAVALKQRGFGLVRYQSSKSVQRALTKNHNDEIVVQDVGVVIKVLESEAPVLEKPSNQRQLPTNKHSSFNASLNKFGSRDTSGYQDGSMGGGRFDNNVSTDKKYRQYDIGSDTGSRSSRKSNHRRIQSGGASTTSGSSGGRNSTRRRKISRDASILS